MDRKLGGLILLVLLALSSLAAASPEDDRAFEAAKKAAAYNMKDPASAQFRNMRYGGHNKIVVCGEINAKNGFGAYAGFTPFMYDPGRSNVTIYTAGSKEAVSQAIMLNMVCKTGLPTS